MPLTPIPEFEKLSFSDMNAAIASCARRLNLITSKGSVIATDNESGSIDFSATNWIVSVPKSAACAECEEALAEAEDTIDGLEDDIEALEAALEAATGLSSEFPLARYDHTTKDSYATYSWTKSGSVYSITQYNWTAEADGNIYLAGDITLISNTGYIHLGGSVYERTAVFEITVGGEWEVWEQFPLTRVGGTALWPA